LTADDPALLVAVPAASGNPAETCLQPFSRTCILPSDAERMLDMSVLRLLQGPACIVFTAFALHAQASRSGVVAQHGDTLQLETIRTVALPSGFTALGAHLLDSLTSAVWGAGELVLIRDDASMEWIRHDALNHAAGVRILDVSPPSLEIANGSDGSLVTLREGRVDKQTPLNLAAPLVYAVPSRDGWLLLTADSGQSDQHQLWFRDLAGGLVLLWPSPGAEVVEGGKQIGEVARRVRLSAGERGIYISELSAPFRTWKRRSGHEGSAFELLAGSRELVEHAATNRMPSRTTVALPMLELDQGYLQQLSDLSRDRRLFVLYDQTGAIIRTSLLDVALGFVASDPATRRLLAVRDTGVQEVVLYRWSWSGGSEDLNHGGER
jgi:hypothetical protein